MSSFGLSFYIEASQKIQMTLQIVREEKKAPNGLVQYFHRLIENDKEIGLFEGSILKPDQTISFTNKEGDKSAIDTLGLDFYQLCKARNLEVLSNNLPEREEFVELLLKNGFRLRCRQVHYSLDLKEFEYKPVNPAPLVYKSMDTLDEGFFKELLYAPTEGDPLEALKEPSEKNQDFFFEESKNYPSFNPAHWLLAYLGDKPVGFILANLNPDYAPGVVAGHMEFFGVLPEFRKQGFGAQIHYYGMFFLKELGAAMFHGNTATVNKGMIRIFEKSDCYETQENMEFLFFDTK